jgi:hypothetical protein
MSLEDGVGGKIVVSGGRENPSDGRKEGGKEVDTIKSIRG